MLLLTWHGTILRVEQSRKRLIHAPLVPARALAQDFAFPAPADPDTAPISLPGGLQLHPGPHPGAGHITRGDKTLIARPENPYPIFSAMPPTVEASVLVLTEAEAAALRAVLSTPHRHVESGVDVPAFALEPGFILTAGPNNRLNLALACPTWTGDNVLLPGGAGTLVALAGTQPAAELPLVEAASPPPAADPAAFNAAATARLTVQGAPEYGFLPLAASFATRDWFYSAATEPPFTGRHGARNIILRAEDAYLLTLTGGRSTIFTRDGVLHAPPPPDARIPYPPGISREADTFFIDEAALADAPTLPGPHALLPAAAESTLLETLLPLVLMAPYLASDTTLLVPDRAPDEAPPLADLLIMFGLDHFRTAAIPAAICRAQTLIWPDHCAPSQLSADTLRAARSRAYEVQPPAEPGRRIFMTSFVADPVRCAKLAANLGYRLIDKVPDTPPARAALFAGATAIIAVHGRLLDNLLFCQPGTQVIELTSNSVWRPHYARLSDQLGLTHAVLPCAMEGDMLAPDITEFGRLLRIMRARR